MKEDIFLPWATKLWWEGGRTREHVNKMALNTEPGSPASAVAALFFLCAPKQLARLTSRLVP